MIYGLLNLSFWGYVGATLFFTHLSIIAVTVYLHRCQAHRAVELHPAVCHVMRFWLWLATGMVTKEWVAVHRKHHARCEAEGDPHSPQLEGINRVLWGGVGLYRRATRDKALVEQYSHGTPDDWIDRNLYQKHTTKGYTLLGLIYLVLFGLPGIAMWLVQLVWIPFWAAGVINGVGHYFGYRNFETPDTSCNIVPWGIIIGGEELHGNHHAFSSSAKFSVRWWEFDIGWMYIRILQALGLAKVKRVAPQLRSDPSKHKLDLESLKALLSNRLRIMDFYRKQVVRPVFQEERRVASADNRGLFKKKVCRLLDREEAFIEEEDKQSRQRLLENAGEKLKTVYQFRLKLQAIWQSACDNKGDILPALQEWCQQAEASGIEVLSQFARQLKTYRV